MDEKFEEGIEEIQPHFNARVIVYVKRFVLFEVG